MLHVVCIIDVQLLNVYGSTTYQISSVPRSFFTASSFMHPPSGSAASIHRDTAIVCLISFVLTHTRPFTPIATSRGNRDPSSGRRKWDESRSLSGKMVSKLCTLNMVNLHSRHLQTALHEEPLFHLPEPFSLPRLSVEALQLRFHVFVGQ